MRIFDTSGISFSNVTDLRIENIDFSRPFFIPGRGYLPIASIIGFRTLLDLFPSKFTKSPTQEFISHIVRNRSGMRSMYFKRVTDDYYHLQHSQCHHLVPELKASIEEYLEHNGLTSIPSVANGHQRTTYENMLNSFVSIGWKKYHFSSIGYVESGSGILYNTRKQMLFALVIREELFRYHKLYFLINGTFDYKAMELWVTPGLDTPQYEHQGLRRAYRSILKPLMEEFEIPIVEDKAIEDIIPRIEIVQNTPAEFNEWKRRLYKEFRDKAHSSITFNFS